ncbi:PKD domain-containing protein [Haloarcula onubensis]|uniref:PKD domain-containing protein n=1 Tax=Haloarcula onubensis TaxID=2950539 RepID=A0ABU2FPP8_9EURY|nr:PKD domain-containing protein [Halomicroarcula sp. S3CR25-11]MDS0282251.1 PKD domain-containing protein [Halomicroarcula sp. S3CR25-11]
MSPRSRIAGLGLIAVVLVLIAAPAVSVATSGVAAQPTADLTSGGSQPLLSTHSPPTASFSYSPSTPNPDDTITLDASDSTDNGTITSYEWDTNGDGDYSDYNEDADDGQVASVTFQTGGTYTVGLRVTDSNGNTDTIRRQITVENPAPTASFSFSPETPNPDDTVTLDASSSSDSDGSITSYEWDTNGDGDYSDYNEDADDGQTSSVTFRTGGTYTVGLRVTDNGGKESTITKQITVDNPAPTASFSYSPSTPNPDDTITLDASSSNDSDGNIVSYEWDTNGDGDYSDYNEDADDGQTTSVSYGTGGTYTVSLRVTDNGGKERSVSKQITVENPTPTASFSYSPSTPNPDDTITLDASSSNDSDGNIVSYQWDTNGDGDYSDYNEDADDGQTTTVSYGTGGTYTVSLRVTDNGGKSVTTTRQITVENPAPTASFSYSPSTPNPDDTITLDASGSGDPDGNIVSYEWDTNGDGDYSDYNEDADDGQTTSVSYGTGGTYTVSLRVTDNGGTERTVTKQITVENPAPTASFSYSPSTPNPDDTITLDASAANDPDGNIVSYQWDTDGDGEYSDYRDDADDGQTTTVSYGTGGTYTVSLRVTDNGGKTVTTTQQITVENTAPNARISVSPAMPTPGGQVQLDGSRSGDPDGQIESYTWYIDGDEIGHDEALSYQFDRRGTYEVRLEVTDNGGLTAANTTTVGVSNPPDPSMTTSPATIGTGASVTFDASGSTDPDGRITSYHWRFEDGTTKTGEAVSRSFDRTGERSVTLTVTDNSGHERTLEETITVYPAPEVSMAITPDNPIEGSPVELTASSADAIRSYQWIIDGSAAYTGATASHAFTEAGDQTVVLRATSTEGVTTQVSQTVSVDQDASFELTSNQGQVRAGETAVIMFSVNNNIPNRGLNASLRLALPDTGVEIESVDGGQITSRSTTNFISIDGGSQDSLRVRMRFNEPGNYSIGGQSVYYYGNQSNSQEASVSPVSITVTGGREDSASSGSGPGFGVVSVLVAVLLLVCQKREWVRQ